jgi:hypothetical protein
LDTPQTKVTKQPHCVGHVNNNGKKKGNVIASDHVIASDITKFPGFVKKNFKTKPTNDRKNHITNFRK